MRGITVIDDFGHHPDRDSRNIDRAAASLSGTAALGSLRAALKHDPTRGLSTAVSRKRSRLADGVFISQVARLDQIPEDERLNPEACRRRDRDGWPACFLRARRRRDRRAHCAAAPA